MKVSIYNFKSITELISYELKPMTILSGVNSSGKSSFIQLLLLLKQTVDLDSTKHQLYLTGELFSVRNYLDILTGKSIENKLRIIFEFEKAEVVAFNSQYRSKIFDSFSTYKLSIEITYDFVNAKIFIPDFSIVYVLPEGDKRVQYVKFKTSFDQKWKFHIDTNNALFGNELWETKNNVTALGFSSMFPSFYEMIPRDAGGDYQRDDMPSSEILTEKYLPKIEDVKDLVNSIFNSMVYIGPLRELPQDEYLTGTSNNYVGKFGENTAQILEQLGPSTVSYLRVVDGDFGISYVKHDDTLLDAIKYWMCDKFRMGKNLYSKKHGEFYSIILENDAGIEMTIKHVGFGISQILPIVLQGLLMQKNGTLLLEQPEIHLHPKLQSVLFDFLYSLVLQGKSVIMETHSDHFITRMRRRIAEDSENGMAKMINLTFMELEEGEVMFGTIDLDDFGTLSYFPRDFVDQSDAELRAIIKAQMKKRSRR